MRFGLADSSPQVGRDWLLCVFKEVRATALPDLLEATLGLQRALAKEPQAALQDAESDSAVDSASAPLCAQARLGWTRPGAI